MSININVNIDGFNLEPLREQAKINAERNRARFIESRRIVDAQKRGEKLREIDLAAGKAQIDIEVAPKNSIIRNNNRYEKPSRKEELAASLFGAPPQRVEISHVVSKQVASETGSWVNTMIAQRYFFSNTTQIQPGQIYIYQTIGWTVRSADWSKSITYNQSTAPPSLPTATWNYSAEQATDQFGNTYYKVNWSNTAVLDLDRKGPILKHIVLPAGGEKNILIVVLLYKHFYTAKNYSGYLETYADPSSLFGPETPQLLTGTWPPTSGVTTLSSQNIAVTKAYICSPRSMREIAVPSKLATIIDELIVDDYNLWLGDKFSVFYDDRDSFVGFGFNSNTHTWTPSVFATLNNVNQFIDPSLLRSFSGLSRVITDDRYGFYGGDPNDRNLYYAYLDTSTDYIDPGDPSPGYPQYLPEYFRKIFVTPIAIPANADSIMPAFRIHAAWDWNEPEYCRTICQALGFTLADLQP